MTLGSIPLPVIAGAVTAMIASIFLYIVVAVKIDVWRAKKTFREENDILRRRCDGLEQRLADMVAVIEEAEQRAAVLVPPPSSRSGMNLNKRLQAARMSKRGERPDQIAAALGLPRNEVELLTKVQQITLRN